MAFSVSDLASDSILSARIACALPREGLIFSFHIEVIFTESSVFGFTDVHSFSWDGVMTILCIKDIRIHSFTHLVFSDCCVPDAVLGTGGGGMGGRKYSGRAIRTGVTVFEN